MEWGKGMKGNQIIDIDKALAEKRSMQKVFYRDNGHPSSVFALLIEHFENCKTNRRKEDEEDRRA